MSCLFCEQPNPVDVLHQTEYWNIWLSWDQTYLGRCIIALKRHCGDLADLTLEEWNDYIDIVKKFETAATTAFGATMFNWACLMNDAYKEQPYTPHVHWHVRPRYNHPVEFSGMRFDDEAFGKHYDRSTERAVPDAVKRAIAEEIMKNFSSP